MSGICRSIAWGMLGLTGIAACAAPASADPLTIYELQSNTTDGDASVYDTQTIDCVGGIVVGKFPGYRYRIALQDPANATGWGGIQVKDWTNDELYNNVEIGDWVSLTNMLVEEYRGNTMLHWQPPYTPGFTVVSQGNPLPAPIALTASQIPAPVYDDETGGWFVENHDAEPYEAMRVTVGDVTVAQMGLGKAADNYELSQDSDLLWAADYMNADLEPPNEYDSRIVTGASFASVTGMLEQYKNPDTDWDYYQLCTASAADIAEHGDGVPTVSAWGAIVMLLLLLTAGTVLYTRRQTSVA